jgi:serine/threonine-protein kinase
MKNFRYFARLAAGASVTVLVVYLIVDYIIMPWYTNQNEATRVPNVVGLPVSEAKSLIERAGLRPKEFEEKPDKQFPIGTVSFQNPSAETVVKFGRGIYLTISGGEIQAQVPALRGKSIREAAFMLERLGLKVGLIAYEPSEEFFANTVISQDVEPGKTIRNGTQIGLIVSQGSSAEQKVVPGIIQKSLTEAQKILTQSGFLVGKVTFVPNADFLPNTVMDQTPKAGELLMFGKTVDVTVSQKPEAKQSFEN